MRFFKAFSCLLAALLFIVSTGAADAQGLKDWAEPKRVFIGNIVSSSLINNISGHESGRAIANLRNEYNAIVFENDMKMGNVLPTSQPSNIHGLSISQLRNTLQTTRINRFLNNANFNGMRKRGHAFIWFNQAPNWLNNNAPNWTAQQVFDFSRKYIYALAQVCGNEIDEWDVINEAIKNSSAGWRTDRDNSGNDVWYIKAISGGSTCYGPATAENYIKMLFVWARDAQPNARLYYNDYSIEFFDSNNNSKNAFMRGKFTEIKNNGAPVDGIGFQSHLRLQDCVNADGSINTGYLNGIKRSMELLDDEGFEVAITELDIRRCGGDGRSAASLENAFYEYTRMFYAQPNCREVLIWGQHDNVSWITPFLDSNCGEATLYGNSNYSQKVAYRGVRGAIQSQPNRSSFGFRSLRGNSGNSTSCSGGGGGGGATPAVSSVTVSDDVTRGGVANVNITYSAGSNQDVWVNFQLDQSPWTSYATARINAVSGANNTTTIRVNIPSNTPIANNAYQFQVVVVPDGGTWPQRLANRARKDVDVVAGSGGGGSGIVNNATYTFRNVATGRYLDSDGAATRRGNDSRIKCGTSSSGVDKRWQLIATDNGYYNIVNGASNRGCIDADGGGNIFNNTIVTSTVNDKEWRAIQVNGNIYRFNNRVSDRGNLRNFSDNTAGYSNSTDTRSQWELVLVSSGLQAPETGNEVRVGIDVADLGAFPNPTSGKLTLTGLTDEIARIRVFNVAGTQVQQQVVGAGQGTARLDISDLSAGVYLISVTQGESHRVLRVSRR